MMMTPDDVDALLHRLPPPEPPPGLRGRVLADLVRRPPAAASFAPPVRRRPAFWGAAALAASLAAFAGIVWIILPHPTKIPGSAQEPPATEPLPFKTVSVVTLPGQAGGPAKISGLTTAGGMLLITAASPPMVAALERTSDRMLWISGLTEGPAPLWPPAVAQGLPEEIRDLDAELRLFSAEIDARLKDVGPSPETAALQKKRSTVRERLRVDSAGDNVYFVSDRTLYCLDRSTAALKWKRLLGFSPTARPLAILHDVFLADASAGRVSVLDVDRQGAEVTSFEGPVAGGLAYGDPFLVFAGPDGFLRAFKVTDGTLIWKNPIEGTVRGEPVIELVRGTALSIRRLVLLAAGRILYSFDLDSGLLAWKFDCGSEITSGPVRKDDAVFVGLTDGSLAALELLPRNDGAGLLRWNRAGGGRFLLKSGDLVYALAANRDFIAVRESTGEVVGRYSARDFSLFAVNPVDGLLYVAGPDGRVRCLAEGQ